MGIDAQTLLDDESARAISRYCLRTGELDACAVKEPLPVRTLLTLLFSAKEAFFKCSYPKVHHHFDYTNVQVTRVGGGRVQIGVVDSPGDGLPAGFTLEGCFRLTLGHAFTAFELPAAGSKPPI